MRAKETRISLWRKRAKNFPLKSRSFGEIQLVSASRVSHTGYTTRKKKTIYTYIYIYVYKKIKHKKKKLSAASIYAFLCSGPQIALAKVEKPVRVATLAARYSHTATRGHPLGHQPLLTLCGANVCG